LTSQLKVICGQTTALNNKLSQNNGIKCFNLEKILKNFEALRARELTCGSVFNKSSKISPKILISSFDD
jgi:hypothetical protein